LPDGTLWFTEENVDQVGVIDSGTGQVREYLIGPGTMLPTNITTGPDGNVWFTEELGNNIVRLEPGDPPTWTRFPVPTEGVLPWDINPGPDGNLWFTTLAGRIIGKVTPQGQITEYTVPGEFGIAFITAGAGPHMWFTENDSDNVGSITVNGRVRQILDTGPYPFGITRGPDGNIWYCVGFGDAIGRVTLPRTTR
jgi:virginiamycin B lyase